MSEEGDDNFIDIEDGDEEEENQVSNEHK